MPPRPGNYFAAVPATLPDGFLETLRKSAPDGLRWFHPADLHFTLAFFGPEKSEHIPALLALISGIELPLTEVTLKSLVALPNPRRPTALAFTVDKGQDELAGLVRHWRPLLLEAAGCAPDTREPLPHLTVARPPRKRLDRPALLSWADSISPPSQPVTLSPPVLYGWSPHRPQRQFRVITSDRQNG